mmetsp:Transcript_14329/g.56389  ORF Transcript_14329/g.56389 Transcript_14329/m.56389 type:complete len:303 (+) Transcript_14329:373-1281(+)
MCFLESLSDPLNVGVSDLDGGEGRQLHPPLHRHCQTVRSLENSEPLGVVGEVAALHAAARPLHLLLVHFDVEELQKVPVRQHLVQREELGHLLFSSGVLRRHRRPVRHNCREFAVEVRREPVARLQPPQQLFAWRRPQLARPHVVPEVLLLPEKVCLVAIRRDSLRPVMGQEDVELLLCHKGEAEDVEVALVIYAAYCIALEGRCLVAAGVVVEALVDARHAANAEAAEPNDAGVAEEVDVGRHPAAVAHLKEVAAGLVVAANEYGRQGSQLLAAVVFVEAAELAVLSRAADALKVSSCVSD